MAATPNKQFKNICVLSRFNYGKYKEFVEVTIDLGWSIAARKLHLVYEDVTKGYQNWSQKLLISMRAKCWTLSQEP